MLRLPAFTYLQPRNLKQALEMKADSGPEGMYVAGGTDLYPNMKRRHQEPKTVIALGRIRQLAKIGTGNGGSGGNTGLRVGTLVTLTEVSTNRKITRNYPAVARAAELISTPLLRNMGTIGGNLCL